jgi:hypothetical protein
MSLRYEPASEEGHGAGVSPYAAGVVFVVQALQKKEFFTGNLLVRNHFIIVMIMLTGLAPWELSSLFQVALHLPGAAGVVFAGRALQVLESRVAVGRLSQSAHGLISHNVLIKWLQKVNSTAMPSTYCLLLLVNNTLTVLWWS